MRRRNSISELDKLDLLILNILKSAPNGLTPEEARASVCEWVARSNDLIKGTAVLQEYLPIGPHFL